MKRSLLFLSIATLYVGSCSCGNFALGDTKKTIAPEMSGKKDAKSEKDIKKLKEDVKGLKKDVKDLKAQAKK